jgi:exonuclease SbcC
MRIERIKGSNLTGLGDMDLELPQKPVLIYAKNTPLLSIFTALLTELFYDTEPVQKSKILKRNGTLDVWVNVESERLHLNRNFNLRDKVQTALSNLIITDETGKSVSLPETMTLGEYIFNVKCRAFQQGALVEWPVGKPEEYFLQRTQFIILGGDEGLSLTKVRDSIAGAQKKVNTESVKSAKKEYDSLRIKWEEAHRQQEEERLISINIKNLREKESLISENITQEIKLLERLSFLEQNSDYRELRKLKNEISRLEERLHASEKILTELTQDPHTDWEIINSLHNECMEWAALQEQVDLLSEEIRKHQQVISDELSLLQQSGYLGITEDKVSYLDKVEKERLEVQEELMIMAYIKSEFQETETQFNADKARLSEFEDLDGLTDREKYLITKIEKYLTFWKQSSIGNFIDAVLQEKLGRTSVRKWISLRLARAYQKYNVLNYQEFIERLDDFDKQRKLTERLQVKLEELREKVIREEFLQNVLHSRESILQQVYSTVKATNFIEWLKGWEDYRQKENELSGWLKDVELKKEQLSKYEKELALCIEQLREKLEYWGIDVTVRDEVLAGILNVAKQLRIKNETEKEHILVSQNFQDMLGSRNMDNLAKVLEPLEDLEREAYLSIDNRKEKIELMQKELEETRQQLKKAQMSLTGTTKASSFSELEKKVDSAKRQWLAYENLQRALDDAQYLLEVSWKEWETKYAKLLQDEAQWITRQFTNLNEKGETAVKTKYFAYRMAAAQLVFGKNAEMPLIFTVSEMNEGFSFWNEVLSCLEKISSLRQLIVCTSDNLMWNKLQENGWNRMMI